MVLFLVKVECYLFAITLRLKDCDTRFCRFNFDFFFIMIRKYCQFFTRFDPIAFGIKKPFDSGAFRPGVMGNLDHPGAWFDASQSANALVLIGDFSSACGWV